MADGLAVPADPGRHEWHRTMRGWHLAFALLAALTAGLVPTDTGLDLGRRYAALAVLAALCCWYAATGARALHRSQGSGLGLAYVAGAVPLTIGLFALVPWGAFMLFMLYPHIWALLPIRRAVACTVAGVVATAGVLLARTGLAPGRLMEVFLPTAVALLVAFVLGVWITRIIEQSRQRAQLVADLAAARTELAAVSRAAGELAERERLAGEIHDTLAQGFTSVLLLLEAADTEIGRDDEAVRRHLGRARDTARENLAEARSLVAALAPPQLRDASLSDALRQVVDRLGAELGVESTLTVAGTARPLPAEQEVVLLRATQEALANVRKHARAGRVEVSLAYHGSGVTLRVADDGRGFDPAAASPGFGLAGMRDRVAQVGGTVTLDAVPAAGTTVRIELAS